MTCFENPSNGFCNPVFPAVRVMIRHNAAKMEWKQYARTLSHIRSFKGIKHKASRI